jgi:microcystin degradation protein MlrC
MRVGILCFQHESNTFITGQTTLADFQRSSLQLGEEFRQRWSSTHHETAGFFQGVAEQGIEAAPLLLAKTTPGPTVTAHALDTILGMMIEQLDRAGKLDGLLIAAHGAGVSEVHRDMDGHWLAAIRAHVGAELPIVCTIDPHVNLTPRMVSAVNALIAYRTNPHLDQHARGLEAAALLGRMLRREVRPTQAAAYPRVAINIERQHTPSPPCKPMYDRADAQLRLPGVLSNSVLLGFPYADVEEMGSAFLVITDNDPALAQRLADELAAYLVEHRREFAGHFVEIDAAIDQALRSPQPACLLDMGDNVGGGAPADGTFMAHALHRRPGVAAFVALCDPQSAQQARDAGVGARLTLAMGGKTDRQHGEPLVAEVTVISLHDGVLHEPQPRHGGRTEFRMGPTAIVRTDGGLTLQLTTLRMPPATLSQVTGCGLDPRSFSILVAKGVQAPVAAYETVCPTIIRVNTSGCTCADMTKMTFAHRRRPLFPFEPL